MSPSGCSKGPQCHKKNKGLGGKGSVLSLPGLLLSNHGIPDQLFKSNLISSSVKWAKSPVSQAKRINDTVHRPTVGTENIHEIWFFSDPLLAVGDSGGWRERSRLFLWFVPTSGLC